MNTRPRRCHEEGPGSDAGQDSYDDARHDGGYGPSHIVIVGRTGLGNHAAFFSTASSNLTIRTLHLKLDEALKDESDQADDVARISGISWPEFPELTWFGAVSRNGGHAAESHKILSVFERYNIVSDGI